MIVRTIPIIYLRPNTPDESLTVTVQEGIYLLEDLLADPGTKSDIPLTDSPRLALFDCRLPLDFPAYNTRAADC